MAGETPGGRGRGRQPEVDQADLAREIAALSALGDEAYQDALGECVLQPDPVEQAAFRSPRLAMRSMRAARVLADRNLEWIRRIDTDGVPRHSRYFDQIPRDPGESDKDHARRVEKIVRGRSDHFRHRLRQEMRLLDAILTGLRAQGGALPNAPSARARARRRLAELHPEEFLALVREEEAVLREQAKEARRYARQLSARMRAEEKAREQRRTQGPGAPRGR